MQLRYWLAGMALMTSVAAYGRPDHKPRLVQLIDMSTQNRPISDEPDPAAVAGTRQPASPKTSQFRVHDLSRRWVAFQMANGWRDSAVSEETSSEVDPLLSYTAGLSIPAWMTQGAYQAMMPSFIPGCAANPYRPAGFLARDAEARRAAYYGLMSNIACEYGVPVGLFDAMIIRESKYRPNALSPKDAYGLAQIMPLTAADLGINRYDVVQNLRGGAKYLRSQLDRFGHYHLALAAYNAGPGRIKNGRVPAIAETRAYVDDILSNWARLTDQNVRIGARTAAFPKVGRRTMVASY